MIKVILGNKGSGNTKELLNAVNAAAAEAKGSVVCIEKGTDLTYDVKHSVRLISATEYGINSYTFLQGFLSGLHGGNFDICDVFVDGLCKVTGSKADSLEEAAEFLAWCEAFGAARGVNFTIAMAVDPETAPENIKKYC